MKRCQKCSRTFPDENQKFCTFDGGLLMADQPTFDPNRTILAPQMPSLPPVPPVAPPPPPKPSAPARDMTETIMAYRPDSPPEPPAPAPRPPTRVSSEGQTTPYLVHPFATSPDGQTSTDLVPPKKGAQTSSDLTMPYAVPTSTELPPPPVSAQPPAPPPQPPPPPPPVPPQVTIAIPPPQPPPPPTIATPAPPLVPQPVRPSLPRPTAPTAQTDTPAKKRSIVPVIIGILVVLLLGVVGLAVAGYVFRGEIRDFLKPYLEGKNRPVTTPVNENSNSNSSTNSRANSNAANTTNTNSAANANSATKKEPPAYVPPSGAVQFTNSRQNLDGDLAEHYVGFSFFYPGTWTKDPKAGIRGATSFAKVDRQFSDSTGDFIQERALFNWYPSKGSYEADQPDFPAHAKKVTDQLAKGLPNYAEVSRGETTVNAYRAYEVRFKGEFKNGTKSLPYWGRVIFLPPGAEGATAGVTIVMLATSYAPGVTGAEDVGVKGELAMILDSFRFAPKS